MGRPIFGSPDVFRLRKKSINSLSCVRPCVRTFRSYSLDRSIFFLIFCMKLGLHTTSMTSKKILVKKLFDPPGGFCTQKKTFWLKNGLLSLYLPNAAIIFGLSALAEGPMDSRSCVRAFVRSFVCSSAARYLEIRASDFSETLPKVASWRD